jgi:DNA gyrase subunit A
VRATKYPITSRGGKGYAILQRGSLEAILPDEAEPIPSLEEIGESGSSRGGGDDAGD